MIDDDFDLNGTEIYQIVANGKNGIVALSKLLTIEAANKKLEEIKRFRKSARLEHWGYELRLNPVFYERNPQAEPLRVSYV